MYVVINFTGFCLFCYKTIEFPNKTAKTIDNITKFIKLVKRFAVQKENKYLCDFLEDIKLIECCKKCDIIIADFCKSYNQIKILEIKLDFMLDKLVDKINHANKVPARWIHVNQVLEKSSLADLEEKSESQNKIRKLRQNVVEACHHRKDRSQPRVLLVRNLTVAKSSIIPDFKISETNQSVKISPARRKYKIQKNWRCNFCEKRFTCKQNIRVHLRIHTGEKPFQCRFCLKDFRFKGDFNSHLTDNHWNEGGVEKERNRKWPSKPVPDGLRIDDEKDIPKTKVQPSERKRLRNKPAVRYSIAGDIETGADITSNLLSMDDDMIECTTFPNHDDEAEYNDMPELENHSGENYDDNFEDPYIPHDIEYSNTNNLVMMERTATFQDPLIQIKVEHQPVIPETFPELKSDYIKDPRVNECVKCGKLLQSAYTLQVHLEYHRNPKERKFNCKVCERRFATKHNLHAYARIHTKKGQSKLVASVQASASRLRLKYLRNKNGNEKLAQKNIKRKEVVVKEIGNLALGQIKAKNVEIRQNRYSLRENRVNKFTGEVDSNDEDKLSDIEYNSAHSTSDTAVSSRDPDRPKLKRGRPKSKKSTSSAKLNIECKICSKQFSSFLRKDRHFKTCHDLTRPQRGKLYSCKMNGCAAYFLTSVQVRKHRMYDHGKTIRERADEKGKFFDCPKCDNRFAQPGQLKKHMEYHKDPRKWKWECESCRKKFAMKSRLLEHMRKMHMNVKLYKCKFCEKHFSKSEYLNKHIVEEHGDEDFNKDEVANETIMKSVGIKSISVLNADKKSVTGPKPKVLQCEICKRKFTSFLRKEIHFKKFHDLSGLADQRRVEKCKAIGCGAYFLEKSQLKIHNSLEHGLGELYERPKKFKCEKCGKGFINKNHLGVHLEYHKNPSEWKFECGTCGKKCVNEFKLKNHTRTHTKERPFQCQFCVEKFGSSSNLKRHLQICHRDEEGIKAELDGKKNYEEIKIKKGTDSKIM